jgi:hypothetical protein
VSAGGGSSLFGFFVFYSFFPPNTLRILYSIVIEKTESAILKVDMTVFS